MENPQNMVCNNAMPATVRSSRNWSDHELTNVITYLTLIDELCSILVRIWDKMFVRGMQRSDCMCREFTGHLWIPLTKASDAELWCFLLFARE